MDMESPALTEAKRILASPPAHMILSTPEWRKLVADLLDEIERLLGGDFTPEEIHGFCHQLQERVPAEEFASGCAGFQRQLYGRAPDADQAFKLARCMGALIAEITKQTPPALAVSILRAASVDPEEVITINSATIATAP